MGTRSGTHPVHTEYQSELVPLSNPAGPTWRLLLARARWPTSSKRHWTTSR